MLERLRRNSFLIVGRAGLDLYADPPGTRIENATSFTAALGGSAANIAVAVARQGGKSALLGAVSDDAVGRYAIEALADYGVDTRFVKTVSGPFRNSLAVVETRAQDCQSVIYRNGAADFQIAPGDAERIDYAPFGALVVTGTSLAVEPSRGATLRAMQLARTAGLALIIDIDYRPYSWGSAAEARDVCLQASRECEIIVGNDEEFAVLAGPQDGAQFAATLGNKSDRVVIYKMGSRGCVSFAEGERFETPAFAVAALKPTGAGDGFMGGLLAGLAAGASLREAVRRGAATAAIVVTRVGCAPAMPDADEVGSFVRIATD